MKNTRFTKDEINKMSAEELRKLLLLKQNEIDTLNEQLSLMLTKKYGRSSEKQCDENQITLFNELEKIQDSNETTEEPQVEKIMVTYTRNKRRKGQREEDLSKLPVEVIEHTIPEEELVAELGNDYERFPDEVYQKLKFEPAKFIVEEHHIASYYSKTNGKKMRAEHPIELMQNSIVTPSLASGIINAKYVNALPLNRIEQELKRNDIILRRQVMAGWMIKLTERYLSLVYDRLKSELLSQSVIHSDETPVNVNKDGRKAGSKSYMWVYRSLENDPHKVILYDYCKTRGGYNIEEYLGDYSGTVVCDGYQAYHALSSKPDKNIKISGCWVHLLRKYKDSVKSAGGSDKKKPKFLLAETAISKIQTIFHEDNKYIEFSSSERLNKRKAVIRPLVEDFFAWVEEHKDDVTRGSNTGKAFTYTINQMPYLLTFLESGDIPLSNNAAEQSIRAFTIGRKNWQVIDTVSGAKNSAIIYGLVETAKSNNLKPYEYFKYLLEEIPKHVDQHGLDFIEELLPWSESVQKVCKITK